MGNAWLGSHNRSRSQPSTDEPESQHLGVICGMARYSLHATRRLKIPGRFPISHPPTGSRFWILWLYIRTERVNNASLMWPKLSPEHTFEKGPGFLSSLVTQGVSALPISLGSRPLPAPHILAGWKCMCTITMVASLIRRGFPSSPRSVWCVDGGRVGRQQRSVYALTLLRIPLPVL